MSFWPHSLCNLPTIKTPSFWCAAHLKHHKHIPNAAGKCFVCAVYNVLSKIPFSSSNKRTNSIEFRISSFRITTNTQIQIHQSAGALRCRRIAFGRAPYLVLLLLYVCFRFHGVSQMWYIPSRSIDQIYVCKCW